MDGNGATWVLLLALATGIALWLWWRPARRWRRWRDARRRMLLEDVLKHIFTRKLEGRGASPESVAGHLGLGQRAVLRLIMKMEAAGLIRTEAGRLHPTEEGEKLASQVVRAHRLWETYLAEEARVPLDKLHRPAETAEHYLSASQVEELEARLGYPRSDPHGDPIPTARGEIAPLETQPLSTWPLATPAKVVHVEDEPGAIFRTITRRGLQPGAVVEVRERTQEKVTISDGEKEYGLPPLAAGNIHVVAAEGRPDRQGLVRLSELRPGDEAEVVTLAPALRGFSRRRLLDLGMTAGVRITAHLPNAFGDPMAFRVRGTTVALRKDQASQIWVKRN